MNRIKRLGLNIIKYIGMVTMIEILNLVTTSVCIMISLESDNKKKLLISLDIIIGVILIIYGRFENDEEKICFSLYLSYMITAIMLNTLSSSILIMITPTIAAIAGIIQIHKKQYKAKQGEIILLVGVNIALYVMKITNIYIIGSFKIETDIILLTSMILQIVGFLKSFDKNVHTLKRMVKTTQTKSETDSLTGLYNRQSMDGYISLLSQKASTFSCIMTDIDNFKKVNDTYGHTSGDEVLKELSKIIKQNTRREDRAFRYGGEEFCIICPDSTAEKAWSTAERLRKTFNSKKFEFNNEEQYFSISLGLSECRYHEFIDVKTLIEKSDEALYQAKQTGKNRTVIKQHE